MVFDGIFKKVKDTILGEDTEQGQPSDYEAPVAQRNADYDGQVNPANPYNDLPSEGQYGDVRPASEDPYGDPAYQNQYGDVRPASEDPYGDPATQDYGDVRPASEDPYGDPAD